MSTIVFEFNRIDVGVEAIGDCISCWLVDDTESFETCSLLFASASVINRCDVVLEHDFCVLIEFIGDCVSCWLVDDTEQIETCSLLCASASVSDRGDVVLEHDFCVRFEFRRFRHGSFSTIASLMFEAVGDCSEGSLIRVTDSAPS